MTVEIKKEIRTCEFCNRLFEYQCGPDYLHQDPNFCQGCVTTVKHYPERILWHVIKRLRALEAEVGALKTGKKTGEGA